VLAECISIYVLVWALQGAGLKVVTDISFYKRRFATSALQILKETVQHFLLHSYYI